MVQNPFDHMRFLVLEGYEIDFVSFAKEHSLTDGETKLVWVACPEFQEQFSRQSITEILRRNVQSGLSEMRQPGKRWLQRRYNLNEEQTEKIYLDISNNPPDQTSKVFLSIITAEIIAATQLTDVARQELINLNKRFLDI